MISTDTPLDQGLANLVTAYVNRAEPDQADHLLDLVERYQNDPYLAVLLPAAVEYLEVTTDQDSHVQQKGH